VRLILESHSERDVYNFSVALAEKFLGTVDALLQYELMRSEPGAEFEQLGEMGLAHLDHCGERANGEWFVEIVADMLDNARQTLRRNAEGLFAGNVRCLEESVSQFARQALCHDAGSHHQKIHAVVFNTVTRRVQVVAHSRAHPGMLVGRHGSSNAARADQHATLDTLRIDGSGEMFGQGPAISLAEIPRREILSGAPLCGKSELEAFLAVEAGLVSTNAYPHEDS